MEDLSLGLGGRGDDREDLKTKFLPFPKRLMGKLSSPSVSIALELPKSQNSYGHSHYHGTFGELKSLA